MAELMDRQAIGAAFVTVAAEHAGWPFAAIRHGSGTGRGHGCCPR